MSSHPDRAPENIVGRCHCGNLKLHLHWPATASLILRVCTCDYCSRQGALWISHHAAPVTLSYAEQDQIIAYRFASESADFLVCRRCGILTMARCAAADGQRAVVNARTLENVDLAHYQQAAAHLGDEDLPTRMARRRRDWSPLSMQSP